MMSLKPVLVGVVALAVVLTAVLAGYAAVAAAVAQAPEITAERDGIWLLLTITDRSVDEHTLVVRHRAPDADEVEARRLPTLSRTTVGRTYPVRVLLERLDPGRHCFVAVGIGGAVGQLVSRPTCITVPWPGRQRLS